MQSLREGTAWNAAASVDRRARVDDRSRRSRAAAGTAHLIGVIVAGGGSTRFGGEPKGLRTVDGTRIIDRVATALRAVTDDLLLAANAPDAQDWLPGVRAVRDTRGERGSLVAIHTALTTAAGDDVLIVAWDMPFVSVGLLRTLHERLTPDVDAVVPESVHGLEPFCAAYSSRVLPHVERAIASGDLRVTRMIDALPRVARLTPENLAAFGVTESTFFNVNTAADLDAAERMARGD